MARQAEDQQDAEMVRVAAYAGLRQGELLALRWRDVDFAGSVLTIARAMSAGVESSTKSAVSAACRWPTSRPSHWIA